MALRHNKPCICVVDDDEAVRGSLELFLSLKGMQVFAYESGKELLEKRLAIPPHLFILDIHMPDMDGFELMRELRLRAVAAPVILMSGLGDQQIAARAETLGVAAFFNKPIDPKVLLEAVIRLVGNPA